ncbi:MAG: glycosyltransferase, partial [Syntrophobacteraceae bacterium]
MSILAAAFFLPLMIASFAFYILCGISVTWFTREKRRKTGSCQEPVSLLVPVCGIDGRAYENWARLCRQKHPDYEVLFCVMDPKDPAVPILKELVDKCARRLSGFTARRVQLHFSKSPIGTNHQICNLIHLLKMAEHEWVVFADSDIRVGPEYLSTVTAPLSARSVGVVTCGYLDRTPRSLGAAVAALDRGIDFTPSVLLARKLDGGLKFAMGATIAVKKSVIAGFGGLETLLNRIGSDYHIGKMASEAGYRVLLSHYVIDNDCGKESLPDVFERELRWARTIRINRGIQFYGLGFSYGTVYCIPLLLLSGFAGWALWACGLVFAARLFQAAAVFWSLDAPWLALWVWALPIREAMNFAVWAAGCFGHTVKWRGRRLRIAQGGLVFDAAKSLLPEPGPGQL